MKCDSYTCPTGKKLIDNSSSTLQSSDPEANCCIDDFLCSDYSGSKVCSEPLVWTDTNYQNGNATTNCCQRGVTCIAVQGETQTDSDGNPIADVICGRGKTSKTLSENILRGTGKNENQLNCCVDKQTMYNYKCTTFTQSQLDDLRAQVAELPDIDTV